MKNISSTCGLCCSRCSSVVVTNAVGVCQAGISQVGVSQVGVAQVGVSQVGVAQVGISETISSMKTITVIGKWILRSSLSLSLANVVTKMSTVGVSQVGVSQVGVSQVGISQVGVSQVGVSQVGVSQVGGVSKTITSVKTISVVGEAQSWVNSSLRGSLSLSLSKMVVVAQHVAVAVASVKTVSAVSEAEVGLSRGHGNQSRESNLK